MISKHFTGLKFLKFSKMSVGIRLRGKSGSIVEK